MLPTDLRKVLLSHFKDEEAKAWGGNLTCSIAFFLKILFMREREREREAERQAEGEAGAMLRTNVGLDPGSPGSRPGPKAALNH